jgi:hypothetical protein
MHYALKIQTVHFSLKKFRRKSFLKCGPWHSTLHDAGQKPSTVFTYAPPVTHAASHNWNPWIFFIFKVCVYTRLYWNIEAWWPRIEYSIESAPNSQHNNELYEQPDYKNHDKDLHILLIKLIPSTMHYALTSQTVHYSLKILDCRNFRNRVSCVSPWHHCGTQTHDPQPEPTPMLPTPWPPTHAVFVTTAALGFA